MTTDEEIARLRQDLAQLRAAIAFLAQCCGAHILSEQDGQRLVQLLTPRTKP